MMKLGTGAPSECSWLTKNAQASRNRKMLPGARSCGARSANASAGMNMEHLHIWAQHAAGSSSSEKGSWRYTLRHRRHTLKRLRKTIGAGARQANPPPKSEVERAGSHADGVPASKSLSLGP